MGDSDLSSSHTASAVGSPHSWPRRRASAARISRSSLASPGGSSAFRTRWTRRSLLVTVPSVSAHPAAAGSTTSAISAVCVAKMSWTTMWSRPSRRRRVFVASASDCAGFSPTTNKVFSFPSSIASNIWLMCHPLRAGIFAPQARSNFALATAASTSWNPGSLFGIAPMSPPPWTLFCPRRGQTPEP